MKKATFAPAYVTLFPMLSDIAQEHGYSLSIHGSIQTDFDLIAIPWVEDAKEPKYLLDAFAKYLEVDLNIFGTGRDRDPGIKPHGRLAWNLYLGNGAKIDLSILPLQKNKI